MVFVERYKDRAIEGIVEEDFLGYAMSTLKDRSLPDVRDGLKPVQRRIMYAMHKLKNTHDKPYKKSARIVGDVIGKYHPHGDTSVYDAMVRMAQDWKLRYTLVQGHGNFGSIDGDAVAAMRYTESRLSEIANLLLRDLKDETVDMQLNFDEQENEPVVIPALLPNLLVNGAKGVATGFATEILPNNLTEVCNAILKYLEDESIDVEDLAECMSGPDFPTGGLMMNSEGIKDIYTKGRGEVTVRGEIEFEYRNNKECLVIKSIPSEVVKERLIEDIKSIQMEYNISNDEFEKESKKNTGKQVEIKGMDFIDAIRDDSDSNNKSYEVEIVLELKEGVNPQTVINNLYKRTDLQRNFNANNLALVPIVTDKGVVTMPTMCNLKTMVSEYVKHQKKVITRKIEFQLRKADKDMYLLGAVIKALSHLDDAVEIIKAANSRDEAIEKLMDMLNIEQAQASHVLSMKLQTLASFEQDEKIAEHTELESEIIQLQNTLKNEELIKEILVKDILDIRERYGDERRTKIIPNFDALTDESLIVKEDVIVMMTNKGFIKRIPIEKSKLQKRYGKGSKGMNTFDGDFVKHLEILSTHDTICMFTKKGNLFKLKAHEIPVMGEKSKGVNIKSIFNIGDDKIQSIVPIKEFDDDSCLLFVTKKGISKRTLLTEYTYGVKSSIRAIKLKDDDELISVALENSKEDNFVTYVTKKGISLTINTEQIKIVSRVGSGVAGINLRESDEVVQCIIHKGIGDLYIATNKGFGKKSKLSEFRVTSRKGRGVASVKTTEDAYVVDAIVVQEEDEIIQLTKKGKVMKFNVGAVSTTGRVTQGLRTINLDEDDELIAISANKEDESEENYELEDEFTSDNLLN